MNIVIPKIQAPKPNTIVFIENVDQFGVHTDRSVARVVQAKPSRGQRLMRQLKSRQDMIILRELLGPPKSAQSMMTHSYWE